MNIPLNPLPTLRLCMITVMKICNAYKQNVTLKIEKTMIFHLLRKHWYIRCITWYMLYESDKFLLAQPVTHNISTKIGDMLCEMLCLQ